MDEEIGKRISSELEMPNITDDEICIFAIVVGIDIGKRTSSELEMPNITDDDVCIVAIVVDIDIGKRTSSELEMSNISDDDICMVSGVTGLGDTKEELVSKMSQNSPVHPGKHSHMMTPAPRSIHSPFVQLTNSHSDTTIVGVGET